MKKIILIALLSLVVYTAFSQIEKNNISILINGNHKNNFEDYNSINTIVNSAKVEESEIGFSIAYNITNHFILGSGLDFINKYDKRYFEIGNKAFTHSEIGKYKTRMVLPSVFGGYNYSIIDKLVFNSCLRVGYTKIKPTLSSTYIMIINPNYVYDSDKNLNIQEQNQSAETEVFLSEISPEFTYLINNWFGVSLNLGGVGYSLNDWDKEKSSWLINFHPQYWKLGLKFVI